MMLIMSNESNVVSINRVQSHEITVLFTAPEKQPVWFKSNEDG